jgi:sporulation protein YlmC with PRC-barrel domain
MQTRDTMQTRMMLLASAAALMLAPAAIAQESIQDPLLPPAQEQAPAEQVPMDSETPQSQAPAQAPTDPAAGDDAIGDVVVEPAVIPPPAEAIIQAQRPNEIRSGNLIGAAVINAEGEEVGKVKDILVDTSGTATGMVLSVGGIMGLGAKDVGLTWQEVDVRQEPDVVRVNYSKAQLEAAPPFMTTEALEQQQGQLPQPGTLEEEPATGNVPPAPASEPTQ